MSVSQVDSYKRPLLPSFLCYINLQAGQKKADPPTRPTKKVENTPACITDQSQTPKMRAPLSPSSFDRVSLTAAGAKRPASSIPTNRQVIDWVLMIDAKEAAHQKAITKAWQRRPGRARRAPPAPSGHPDIVTRFSSIEAEEAASRKGLLRPWRQHGIPRGGGQTAPEPCDFGCGKCGNKWCNGGCTDPTR